MALFISTPDKSSVYFSAFWREIVVIKVRPPRASSVVISITKPSTDRVLCKAAILQARKTPMSFFRLT